jgi:D-alanyl-D-alanine carboxypeptidase
MNLPRRASLVVAVVLAASAVLGAPQQPAAAGASFSDIGASPFRVHIEWLAERGITEGCGGGKFCPRDPVTREQMAKFLVRLFELPPTPDDLFTDDDSSVHESAINALAASGITGGCAPDRFCPRDEVTRAQMAAVIARAAALPPTDADHFLDDESSSHELSINRVAAAGITAGCGLFRFCPAPSVTREQMAAFLHRVEAPGTPPNPLPDGGPLPACRYDDVPAAHRGLGDWSRTLLDTIYLLAPGYAPTDLVSTSAAGANAGYQIRRVALADATALFSAASAAGRPLRVVSAYRSYATQQAVFSQNVARYGEAVALRRSARPGHSEHQLGTTLDVTHSGGAAPWNYSDWATHPTGAWMRDNAWRYGFLMSYPKGKASVSCYDYEPWHYRYVGRPMAAEVHASGLTLREWIWRVHGG